MDKGQHLRLWLKKSNAFKVLALCTEFSFHASATTENSTTKDSTDLSGLWEEYEVTAKSYDMTVTAMIGVGTDIDSSAPANTLNDILTGMTDTEIDWEMAVASGNNNRTEGTKIASGKCKIVGVNPVGQNRQFATYTVNLNGVGAITVASS